MQLKAAHVTKGRRGREMRKTLGCPLSPWLSSPLVAGIPPPQRGRWQKALASQAGREESECSRISLLLMRGNALILLDHSPSADPLVDGDMWSNQHQNVPDIEQICISVTACKPLSCLFSNKHLFTAQLNATRRNLMKLTHILLYHYHCLHCCLSL